MWLAGSDDGISKVKDPIVAIVRWIKSRSSREKTYLGGASSVCSKSQASGVEACVLVHHEFRPDQVALMTPTFHAVTDGTMAHH